MIQEPASHPLFVRGMYVRLPYEIQRDDQDYRDYRIGQVLSVDEGANTASVQLQHHALHDPPGIEIRECRLDLLDRCLILQGVAFRHALSDEQGRVLIACEDTWTDGVLRDYYVQFMGVTCRLNEAEIVVSSGLQDPNPLHQLRQYEFQHPIWKFPRDGVIRSVGALRNATFGIEDLVGSRVTLLAHQAEVIATVLSDPECRYILADEVGLGKTIEACVILKSLRHRDDQLRSVIVAPASLTQQWQNELSHKFWMDFPIVKDADDLASSTPEPEYGVIVSAETLRDSDKIWEWLRHKQWGLLIIDEAHHIWKSKDLYARLHALSRDASRSLVLSATPIQRRGDEFLALLKLMSPEHYDGIDNARFNQILETQAEIRRVIAYLAHSLTPDRFDSDEFVDEMQVVAKSLADAELDKLITQVQTAGASTDRQIKAAREALTYVSENYRIESHVIRNRRAHLQIELPTRVLDYSYAYRPGLNEEQTLDALHTYVDTYLRDHSADPVAIEYARVLFHAAASSPHALLTLIAQRLSRLTTSIEHASKEVNILSPAPPRQEVERIRQLVNKAPVASEERDYVNGLLLLAERWRDETERSLEQASARRTVCPPSSQHRLVQVLRAIYQGLGERAGTKILIFSAWPQTLDALHERLKRVHGRSSVAEFRADMDVGELQDAADRFQADDDCRILLCDELGGEGRNFQIADQIVHVDLPWTPAQVEQRIGRVDRLGRRGEVCSIVPYAIGQLEHDLLGIWEQAYQLFTQSMSGMEIALEGIQSTILEAFASSSRLGIQELLDAMVERASELRMAVEEERYFEEGAVNYRRRAEFQSTSDTYRDGKLLRDALLYWSDRAGLCPQYHRSNDIVIFDPKKFNLASLKNAKLFDLPNMEDALRRSGRRHNLVLSGTFNRDIAVRREDLIFFAPGNDPWTDALISSAMEADRGRCCAIRRLAPELERNWEGFELLFSLGVDPRPLYAAGYDPTHLFRAQGFLNVSHVRLLIATDGSVEKGRDIRKLTEQHFDKRTDVHLGKRDGGQAKLFHDQYPPEQWHILVDRLGSALTEAIAEELDFTPGLAEEAREEFEKRAVGLRAGKRWRQRQSADLDALVDPEDYERVSAALAEGIERPVLHLESVCYWYLEAGKR